MGTARDAAIEYFRCMREGDADSIERLFAPDAVLSVFNGTLRRGRREIRDFYENSGMQQGFGPTRKSPSRMANGVSSRSSWGYRTAVGHG